MSLRALRPFSTSVRALQRIPQVHPADVVAGKAPGPPVERLTPEEVLVATVSDAPRELQHRQVRIFKPTKNTMQSAKGKTRVWRIDWDVLPGSGRWTNPLMGWQSSADYMQGTTLAFRTREDAVRFAERQGWDYYISEPKKARIPPKNYADNYLYVDGPLRICHTK
ncbi:hypothetical protein CC85DRAFT_325101 [Cutaneotrichosporon oleaginosum]|uniref:NADH dehydrogenase [ubiquinone] iron-sulfur protein 4, mitochondrial n=1 Tax=Cutaneotrichosporon oleaginosum TaxID=879819 RepID=A0A0J0XXK7_9TREE|nr:uncharacterized protein CC85DRAFT_325101 [Cutaneotrichosporon oleaginosum]KLT45810.1 hypothetical protein CC85DRAFT_325101 [Cutaneotrichosporon oleaginosum]TXT06517.1 hypothetical protein COLE_05848 [Cutaneotrichosporon oleaginosum]